MSIEPEVEQVSSTETDTRALSSIVGEIRWWARDVFFAVGTAIMIVVFGAFLFGTARGGIRIVGAVQPLR